MLGEMPVISFKLQILAFELSKIEWHLALQAATFLNLRDFNEHQPPPSTVEHPETLGSHRWQLQSQREERARLFKSLPKERIVFHSLACQKLSLQALPYFAFMILPKVLGVFLCSYHSVHVRHQAIAKPFRILPTGDRRLHGTFSVLPN